VGLLISAYLSIYILDSSWEVEAVALQLGIHSLLLYLSEGQVDLDTASLGNLLLLGHRLFPIAVLVYLFHYRSHPP